MDGRIGFDGDVEKGSTFWVELPVSDGVFAEAALRVRALKMDEFANQISIQATILYIEDNPANLQLMDAIMDRLDSLTLISAHNAELGLAMASERQPDLILMDLNLPGMDGFEALKELANNSITQNIPVIAISARALKSDIEKGLDAGFKAYVSKPFNVPKFIEVINKVLSA